MSPVSPIPAVVAFLIALLTCQVIMKRYGSPSLDGRFASIDGLRGYLAFSVFLHHACIWFFYLQKKGWAIPPSNLYTHLGQSSVSLFFMITGFLFFSKVIESKEKGIDWMRLLVSRVLRLTPLYFFAMTIIFTLAIYASQGIFNQPVHDVQIDVLKWYTFRIFGDKPNLGGINEAFQILAGVTLTLRHEWYFYFSLPALAYAMKSRPPVPLAMLSLLALLIWRPHGTFLLAFLCGMLAARLVRNEKICDLSRRWISSMLVVSLLTVAVVAFPVPYESTVAILLIGIAFIVIACGSTIFGILSHPSARFLGEISYSIYLLHGILLFVLFNFVLPAYEPQLITPVIHWAVVVLLTPILVITCFITFRLIENPPMRKTLVVSNWLRSRLCRQ